MRKGIKSSIVLLITSFFIYQQKQIIRNIFTFQLFFFVILNFYELKQIIRVYFKIYRSMNILFLIEKFISIAVLFQQVKGFPLVISQPMSSTGSTLLHLILIGINMYSLDRKEAFNSLLLLMLFIIEKYENKAIIMLKYLVLNIFPQINKYINMGNSLNTENGLGWLFDQIQQGEVRIQYDDILLTQLKMAFQQINKRQLSLSSLKVLYLTDNGLDNDTLQYLLSHKLQNLTDLNLTCNNIGSQGLKHIGNGYIMNLSKITLINNNIGFQGIKYLSNYQFSSLKEVCLVDNNIGAKGTKYFIKSNFLGLIKLDLSDNNIGIEGIKYLSGFNFQNLNELYLNHNNFGGEGTKLLSFFYFKKIKVLSLYQNKIDTEALKNLTDNINGQLSQIYVEENCFFNQMSCLYDTFGFRDKNNCQILVQF